jgi:diaminohydroxyphosphoribosylaminopyrimidine deaminase/5-amino-6-(5-phosphoribosylamino)uracil reductase
MSTHPLVERGDDTLFMRLALREAWKGLGTTSPNPMVGAVIVKNSTLLARGFHAIAGEAHAEIAAFRALSSPEQAHGATLYVTLEPCSSYGRTPPCTQAIIEAGVTRVVYGATDPDPRHRGGAKKVLEESGIAVTTGIMAKKCVALNHAWHHRMKTAMPWVIAKCGMSLDGRIASPSSHDRWITSEASRHHAMLFRRHVDAILVGGATVRNDNPKLTLRTLRAERTRSIESYSETTDHALTAKELQKKAQPWRIIWTRSEKNIPPESHLLTDEHRDKTILLQGLHLREALQHLAARGISSVLIEGGGITLGSAFQEGLVDEVRFYIAPKMLGGPTLALHCDELLPAVRLTEIIHRRLGDDFFISALVEK